MTPKWKFYHPLSIWTVLGIVFVANVVCLIVVVALREGLQLQIPIAAAGGAGGVSGLLIVMGMARKRAEPPADDGS